MLKPNRLVGIVLRDIVIGAGRSKSRAEKTGLKVDKKIDQRPTLLQKQKNQIFIVLAVLRRSVKRVIGPISGFSALATQLRKNIAEVAGR